MNKKEEWLKICSDIDVALDDFKASKVESIEYVNDSYDGRGDPRGKLLKELLETISDDICSLASTVHSITRSFGKEK